MRLPRTITEDEPIAVLLFLNSNSVILGKFEAENIPSQPYTNAFDIKGYGPDFTIVVADFARLF